MGRIATRPLLIVHGAENELYKPIEARSLYEHAREPKQLVFFENHGHTEWMFDENPPCMKLIDLLDEFVGAALGRAQTKRRSLGAARCLKRVGSETGLDDPNVCSCAAAPRSRPTHGYVSPKCDRNASRRGEDGDDAMFQH